MEIKKHNLSRHSQRNGRSVGLIMKVTCCDNCKRGFEPFEVGNCPEGTGYGFIVPEDSQDPTYLMSDLELSFLCFTDKEPQREKGKLYWCVKCIDNIYDEVIS
jgi:hypothetical protein